MVFDKLRNPMRFSTWHNTSGRMFRALCRPTHFDYGLASDLPNRGIRLFEPSGGCYSRDRPVI